MAGWAEAGAAVSGEGKPSYLSGIQGGCIAVPVPADPAPPDLGPTVPIQNNSPLPCCCLTNSHAQSSDASSRVSERAALLSERLTAAESQLTAVKAATAGLESALKQGRTELAGLQASLTAAVTGTGIPSAPGTGTTGLPPRSVGLLKKGSKSGWR